MTTVKWNLRWQRQHAKSHCRECGRVIKKGLAAYRITQCLILEMSLNSTKSYLLHEGCLEPITLVETTLEGYALLIEKDDTFGS